MPIPTIPPHRATLTPPQDPLGHALHHLRLQSALCCRSELTAPWSIDMPIMPDTLMVHVVTQGSCWLQLQNQPPIQLHPGHVALVAHGKGHQISSAPNLHPTPLFSLPITRISDRYELLQHGGPGPQTTAICAVAHLGHPIAQKLTASLPPHICVNTTDPHTNPHFENTLALLTHEAQALRPGGETIISRLTDILVIQILRAWIEDEGATHSQWLKALQDPQVGKALALIHQNPQTTWTVETLARTVATSRSGFAARFRAVVGQPPMQYLTDWRMAVARDMLKTSTRSLLEVAEACGYASEAAFSRAFRRHVGTPPGAFRTQAGQHQTATH